jgi:hypothetical protein
MEAMISNDMDPATGTSVYENVSKQKMTSLKCYISVQQRKFMDNCLLENQLSATEMQRAPDIYFKNPKWRAFHDKSSRLCGRQRLAFDIATSYINGSRTGQLQMFMSGEGGTGKSEVIKFIMEYTRLFFGKTRGLYGPVVALGPTGVASNNIGGFTRQSVCKM